MSICLTRLFSAAFLFWPLAGSAFSDPQSLSIVADQAVLVHRITKSACLVLSGAETPVHGEDVVASTGALSTYLDVSPAGGAAIARLAANVDTLNRSALQISAGDRHSVAVALMLRKNLALSDQYVDLRKRAETSVNASNAAAYALIHELRIASQAFQRDLCLYLTDLASKAMAHDLSVRMDFFANTLAALLVGDATRSVVPPPNIHIKITLRKIESKWRTLAPILGAAAKGQLLDARDAQLASVLGDAMLRDLDAIVARFEAL